LALAPRRADLEREAATIYAKSFSTEELNAIAKFFDSDVGKKFLKEVPLANRQLAKAADIWGTGIKRDLVDETSKALENVMGDKPGDKASPKAN
jgi:hypothetical protein